MKNGITDEEMEFAKSELKSIFNEENNVFTGIVFKWREVRGKENGETLIAGNPETKERFILRLSSLNAGILLRLIWAL